MFEYQYVDADVDRSIAIVTIRGNGFGRTHETDRMIVVKTDSPTIHGLFTRGRRKNIKIRNLKVNLNHEQLFCEMVLRRNIEKFSRTETI